MTKPRSILAMALASFCLLLVGCNVPLFGYPRFWDHPQSKPTDAELVGTYKVSKVRLSRELSGAVHEKEAVITLNAYHTATLTNFPDFGGFGLGLTCRFSGSVRWQVDNVEDYWVSFESHHPEKKMQKPECELENSVFPIIILSRRAPYRLYWTVGDPDSDQGIEFEQVGR
jgi:hypothetical protein